jgi:nucleotide-binding universal stress UspA family protein
MYRSLLVPLDGSAFAEHALPLALSVARRAGASIDLVKVHIPFTMAYADSPSPFSDQVEDKVTAQEWAYLDAMTKRIRAASALSVTSVLLESEVPSETLSRHAATSGADLIVMTTHGHGPFSRFWLGSVADEMVRRATTPILLVRPHEKAIDLASEPVLRHILIPLDGAALAEHVLEPATALGSLMQCDDYSLLRVVGPPVETEGSPSSDARTAGLEPPIEHLRAEAQGYLNRVAERLQGQGFKVQTHVVAGKYPPSAILDAVHSLAVDLIALETHGRRGLRRLLVGSVADKVIRGASTPVLVHRSPGK